MQMHLVRFDPHLSQVDMIVNLFEHLKVNFGDATQKPTVPVLFITPKGGLLVTGMRKGILIIRLKLIKVW